MLMLWPLNYFAKDKSADEVVDISTYVHVALLTAKNTMGVAWAQSKRCGAITF